MARSARPIRLFLIVAALLVTVPGAHGQDDPEVPDGPEGPELDMTVVPNGQPIMPITGRGLANVTVTLTCSTGAVYTETTAYGVTLDVEAEPSWATAVLTRSVIQFDLKPEACLAGTELMQQLDVGLIVSDDAPALAPIPLVLTATPPEGDPVTEAWNETAGVFLRTQARFEKTTASATPGETIPFIVTVENLGNSEVTVETKFAAPDETDLEVAFASATVPAGGTEHIEILAVAPPRTDGVAGDQTQLNIDVVTTSVDDSALTKTQVLSAVIKTTGLGEEAPAPPLFLLILLLTGILGSRRP